MMMMIKQAMDDSCHTIHKYCLRFTPSLRTHHESYQLKNTPVSEPITRRKEGLELACMRKRTLFAILEAVMSGEYFVMAY